MERRLCKVMTYFMSLSSRVHLQTIKFQSCLVTATQRIFIWQFHVAKIFAGEQEHES